MKYTSRTRLLTQTGELLKLAQIALKDSGYQYKKGKSRSKVFGEDISTAAPKRPKISPDFRSRTLQIEEETKSLSKRISFKEKRVELAAQDKNFKLCDQVMEEIADLQSKRRTLESELRELQKKGEKG